MAIADQICLHDEVIDDDAPLEIFDPESTWKRKTLTGFTAKELMVPVFINGELVYDIPELDDVRRYCRDQLDTLWPEVKRFSNPHHYYVDLSQRLWDIKNSLLNQH